MTVDSEAGIYRDRLTGECVPAPPGDGTLVGRWVLAVEHDPVFVNSAAAAKGDFLVPEPSGYWDVLTETGQRRSGKVARVQVPDELEAESVRTIGDKLERLTRAGASWIEWLDVVPLVPGISEQVDIQPLELLTREHFGQLETVCRKPRAHLQVELERVPVSKARRIPPSAASYLASHTEDWDQPLLRSILPKRVIAEVRHDQVDIYENRVAARLVDHLGAYLNRRIRVLRRLIKVFRDKEDYSGAIAGTYQRRRRTSELWGQSIDANEGRRKAEATLRELEWLKYKVMGLLGSTLYEEVPRRAHIATTLKGTNILTNDPRYRRLAELWREWARTGAGRTQSPSELHAEAQRLCRGLDAFAMLLTVRALDTLGYEPSDEWLEMPLARGRSLPLRGHGVGIAVAWRGDGTIRIEFGQRQLTIVALSSDLGAGTDERIRESLGRIRRGFSQQECSDLLVLFLASDDDRPSTDPGLIAALHTVGNDPRTAIAGGGCLPISPWEIGSTERVARALRWFLMGSRFLSYPRTVAVSPRVRELLDIGRHSRWLRDDEAGVEFSCPPAEFEWVQLNVDQVQEEAASRAEDAETDYTKVVLDHKTAKRRDDGYYGAGTWETKRRWLKKEEEALKHKSKCETELEQLSAAASALNEANERTQALLRCPSCGKRADPVHDFEIRDRGCFRCSCKDCHATWETRLCSAGHRFGIMLPGGKFIETEDDKPGWEDRVYGCDLLAVPARLPDGRWGFICPECGMIS